MLYFMPSTPLRNFPLDLSFDLGPETTAIIGRSGSGKSTTLRILAGLLTPGTGRIILDDTVLLDTGTGIITPPEERQIGYVVQNYALFPHLSVAQNVAYGVRHLPINEQHLRVQTVLNLVDIRHLAAVKPRALSGGEQQRVALARALATRPRALLLDEPLAALDVSTRTQVRSDLRTLLRRLLIPTIVVTHDYDDARVLADRVAVMDRGRIIQIGTVEQVSRFPISPFVAAFTDTNLVPVDTEDGIAFDPWKVNVSRELTGPHRWEAQVKDIVWTGDVARLRLETTDGLPLLADVRRSQVTKEHLKLGATVSAHVDPDQTRIIPGAGVSPRGATQERREDGVMPPLDLSRRGFLPLTGASFAGLAVAIIVVLGAAGIALAMARNSSVTGDSATKTNLAALVAANLTQPFNTIIQRFSAQHHNVSVTPSYAGTQILETQLEQGQATDLFISADLAHIKKIQREGLVTSYVPISRMHEVIIVPKSNPAGIRSLEDLGTRPVRLVIGVPSVPIGAYTRQVLQKADKQYGAGFSTRVMSRVVSNETNVKQVLQKVVLGDAQAGIVYRTDVNRSFRGMLMIVPIPTRDEVEATNYAAVPRAAPHGALAKKLLVYLRSSKGQAVFVQDHYDPLALAVSSGRW